MGLLKQLHSILAPETPLGTFYTSSVPLFRTHRILPLVSEEAASSDEIPPETKQAARDVLYRSKSEHIIYINTLNRVIEVLDRERIEFILLKGASLWKYYTKPYLRQQDDIDILVSRENLPKVLQAVTKEWGTGRTGHGEFHTSCRLGNENAPDLEVHTQTGPPYKNSIPANIIFSNTETADITGMEVQVLRFPLLFRHVCFHAANHCILTRILWLYDLKLLAESGEDLSFLGQLRGISRRSCTASLHYAHLIFTSPSLAEVCQLVPVSRLFTFLISKIVPPSRLLDNPVLTSSLRNALYNLFLIQNPMAVARAVHAKVFRCQRTEVRSQ